MLGISHPVRAPDAKRCALKRTHAWNETRKCVQSGEHPMGCSRAARSAVLAHRASLSTIPPKQEPYRHSARGITRPRARSFGTRYIIARLPSAPRVFAIHLATSPIPRPLFVGGLQSFWRLTAKMAASRLVSFCFQPIWRRSGANYVRWPDVKYPEDKFYASHC